MNSIKASSMWLCLMKTSATKDIPYERCALKHKSKAFSLELALIPLTFFPYYNFPAVVIYPLPSRACLTHSQEHFTPAHRTCIFSEAFMSKKCLTVRKARNTLKPPIDAPRSDFLILSLHTNACQIHIQAGGLSQSHQEGVKSWWWWRRKLWILCDCKDHRIALAKAMLNLLQVYLLVCKGFWKLEWFVIYTSPLTHPSVIDVPFPFFTGYSNSSADTQVWFQQQLFCHLSPVMQPPLYASTVPCVIFLQFHTALKVKFVTNN